VSALSVSLNFARASSASLDHKCRAVGQRFLVMSALEPRALSGRSASFGGKEERRASRAAPRVRLVCEHHLLEEHIASDVTISGALTTARYLLAIVALQVGVHFLIASDLLGRSRNPVAHRHQV